VTIWEAHLNWRVSLIRHLPADRRVVAVERESDLPDVVVGTVSVCAGWRGGEGTTQDHCGDQGQEDD
jgi:hypothetical protein